MVSRCFAGVALDFSMSVDSTLSMRLMGECPSSVGECDPTPCLCRTSALVDQSLLTCHLFPSSFSFMIWYDVNWCTVPSSNQANGRSFIDDPFKTSISFVDFTARHDEWRVNMVIFYSQLLKSPEATAASQVSTWFSSLRTICGSRPMVRCPVPGWSGSLDRRSGILSSGSWSLWAMERSTILNGKTHYKWQFSIAMLNYQRVLD